MFAALKFAKFSLLPQAPYRWGDFAIAAGLIIIAAVISHVFYNLLLHPLRSFPGLWLWTAFRAPFSVSAIKGDLEHKIAEHHLRYGPVVRIAPDQLAFTDPAAWQDIYGMLPDRRQNQKDRYAYPRVIPDQDKGLVFANDDAHSRLRRLFSPAFSPRAVRQHEVTLLKQIEILIRELKQAIAKGGLQVVNGWYQRLIFDIAGEMVYGSSFRTLEIPELRPWMRSIAFAPEMGSVLAQLDRYGLWELIRVVGAPWLDPMIEKVFDYSNALADERAQRRSDAVTSDLFNRLVNNGEEGGAAALTRAELRINALIFLVATSATIATQLSVATWYLCASPIIHRRVKQEVRSSFRSDQEISVKAVNELTYLGAVLRETLRIVPPAAFGLSRVITSPGGQHIAGHHVPQGSVCGIHGLATSRYPGKFFRPNDFVPDRWLDRHLLNSRTISETHRSRSLGDPATVLGSSKLITLSVES